MIRGEKIFTDRVRKQYVNYCLARAQKLRATADGMEQVACDLLAATTAEQLRKLDWAGSGMYPYYCDDRPVCHYCKRKEHGGISGSILSKPERFCCWRERCYKLYTLEMRRDQRRHPRRYQARRRQVKEWNRRMSRGGRGRPRGRR